MSTWIHRTYVRENHGLMKGHDGDWRCIAGQGIYAATRWLGRLADRIDPISRPWEGVYDLPSRGVPYPSDSDITGDYGAPIR